MLGDGTVVHGEGFGAVGTAVGELVFNTGMVGYTETLTDPSYAGQLVTITYPLVGNYGVPDTEATDADGIRLNVESSRIHARGLVVHDLPAVASHRSLVSTLDEWLHREGVQGIAGVDTRELTKRLRSAGSSMAAMCVSDSEIDVEAARRAMEGHDYASERLVESVSTRSEARYGEGRPIVVIDTGAKNAILRNVRRIGHSAVLVPWDTPASRILEMDPAAVIISNGPGDPLHCGPTIEAARELIKSRVPTLGICLGAQIIALAGGASTYKMKYGHRGQNKPCLDVGTGGVYVTSQNHGYCIDPESLDGSEFDLWFTNTDDKTVEGIRHSGGRCIAVQFHPEASPGPYDCGFVFDELARLAGEGSPA
ncbi:MAG: glutamine-hydrolyzing carbamoyl-phosphate synthase small subunit [Thaumarchaeota archaeon]|nr:glutamine-hydrolyzing carbamoyl-phosphate synthase small subunit [Nitrososphaerota archaeon]MDD9813157.1 glutamine-hydrolyzing carbamoyl-phosphate synthase small subunit [Nitrososphaerota archaeon]